MLAELATVLVRRDDPARFIRPLTEAQQQALAALVTRRRQFLCRLLNILTDSRQATGQTLAILTLIAGPSVEGVQKRRPSLRP
jgi:hypothetical protein